MSNFKPETKKSGDIIKSSDWNAAMGEIARLGTLPLTIAGSLAATNGQTEALTAVKIEPAFNTPDDAEIGRYGLVVTSGAVGIGTDAPEADLHVQGSLKLGDGLSVAGFTDDLEESPEGTNLVPTGRAVSEAIEQLRKETTGAMLWLRAQVDGIRTSLTTGSLTLGGTTVGGITTSTNLVFDHHGALPTQGAVKGYVDAQVAAMTGSLERDLTARNLTVSGYVHSNQFVRVARIVVQGTNWDRQANSTQIPRLLLLNGRNVYTGTQNATIGLALTVISKTTLTPARPTEIFDLYDDHVNNRTTNTTRLIDSLSRVTADQIGILVSYDAWMMNEQLRTAFRSLGLSQAAAATIFANTVINLNRFRVSYAALFEGGSETAERLVVERLPTVSANAAEIAGYLYGGSFTESLPGTEGLLNVVGDLNLVGRLHVSDRVQLVQEDWQTPTLNAGWANMIPTTNNPAGYYKDSTGRVHLRGQVTYTPPSTNTAAGVIYTLPEGYRPQFVETFATIEIEPNDHLVRLGISARGEIGIPSEPARRRVISLDGISFRAA